MSSSDAYIKRIVRMDGLKPVLDVLIELGNSSNLIHSSCLELLHIIEMGSSNMRPLTCRVVLRHLCDKHAREMAQLTYLPVVRSIMAQYAEQRAIMAAERTNSGQTEADTAGPERNNDNFADDDDEDEFTSEDDIETRVGPMADPSAPSLSPPQPKAAARRLSTPVKRSATSSNADLPLDQQTRRRRLGNNDDTSEQPNLPKDNIPTHAASGSREVRVGDTPACPDKEVSQQAMPDSAPIETSEAVISKRRSGSFRRTLATASKKLSVTLKKGRFTEAKKAR
jgi:hypothetical protein